MNESGSSDNNQVFNGLYLLIRTTIETEQRRAYQTVKFLITLSNKWVKSIGKGYFKSRCFCLEAMLVKIIFLQLLFNGNQLLIG